MQTHTPPVWMKDEDDDHGFSLNISYGSKFANGSEENTPAISETASTKDDSSVCSVSFFFFFFWTLMFYKQT